MADFELKTEVSSLEGVPEALHPFYVEQDGKFKLEDVSGLKSALQKEREEVKKLKGGGNRGGGDNLSAAEKAELEELRTAKSKREEEDLRKRGEFDKILGNKTTEYNNKLKEKDERIAKTEGRLHREFKTNAATLAIAKLKGKTAALLPHVLNHLKVNEKGDEYEVVVVDRDGTPRNSVKDPTKFMSVEELVEKEFADNDDFMGLFEGRSKSGSGASNGSGGKGNGGAVTITRSEAKDHSKYNAAKERAAKAGVPLDIIDG